MAAITRCSGQGYKEIVNVIVVFSAYDKNPKNAILAAAACLWVRRNAPKKSNNVTLPKFQTL